MTTRGNDKDESVTIVTLAEKFDVRVGGDRNGNDVTITVEGGRVRGGERGAT